MMWTRAAIGVRRVRSETGPGVIMICDNCEGIQGLMGTDLMRRYGITVDPSKELVHARKCLAPAKS